jgi:hypothetical protein
MKMMYCWRCGNEQPMLDEREYAECLALFGAAFKTPGTMTERFAPLVRRHQEITGILIDVPGAIMHHRASAFGAPCRQCGKPLRSPTASYCAACGHTTGH